MKSQKLEISTSSIVKFFAVAIGLYFLWFVRDVLALLFVVLIIIATLGPSVNALEKSGIPRVLGVLSIYLAAFLILATFVSMIVPPLAIQLRALAVSFPDLVARLSPFYHAVIESNAQDILNTLSTQLGTVTQGVFTATANIFGGVVATVTVLVISFYMLVDAKQNRDSLVLLVPPRYVKTTRDVIARSGEKLGSWLRGQIFLSVVIGLFSFVGLLVLNVPYALTLAVLAGLLEIIPFIGPLIAGLAAVIVAYSAGSWQLSLIVFVFYVVIQQVESHFLVPKVMSKAVGLSPVIVIIALLVGAKLAGITGAVLAVPLVAALSVLIQEWTRFQTRSAA